MRIMVFYHLLPDDVWTKCSSMHKGLTIFPVPQQAVMHDTNNHGVCGFLSNQRMETKIFRKLPMFQTCQELLLEFAYLRIFLEVGFVFLRARKVSDLPTLSQLSRIVRIQLQDCSCQNPSRWPSEHSDNDGHKKGRKNDLPLKTTFLPGLMVFSAYIIKTAVFLVGIILTPG